MWQNIKLYRGEIKVMITLPVNDLFEHDEPGYLCRCKPKIIVKKRCHDRIIHNSFDRRELEEKKIC